MIPRNDLTYLAHGPDLDKDGGQSLKKKSCRYISKLSSLEAQKIRRETMAMYLIFLCLG